MPPLRLVVDEAGAAQRPGQDLRPEPAPRLAGIQDPSEDVHGGHVDGAAGRVGRNRAVRRRDEKPARRPPALIRPSELGVLIGACAAFTIVGQMIWLLANSVEVVPTEDFPIRWVEQDTLGRTFELPGGMNTGTTRFVVLVGMLFFGTLLARLVFGYWRLRTMNAEEGGMILVDYGWSESSRERRRQEAWRIWGRKRLEWAASRTETTTIGEKP